MYVCVYGCVDVLVVCARASVCMCVCVCVVHMQRPGYQTTAVLPRTVLRTIPHFTTTRASHAMHIDLARRRSCCALHVTNRHLISFSSQRPALSSAVFVYEDKNVVFGGSGSNYDDLLTKCVPDDRWYAFVRLETGDELSKRCVFQGGGSRTHYQLISLNLQFMYTRAHMYV